MKKLVLNFAIVIAFFSLQSCEESSLPDPTPGDITAFTIYLSDSPYKVLENIGGSATITAEKVIVARLKNGTWEGVSSNCPNDNSAPIEFLPASDTFRCTKDNTTFDKDGKVLSGTSAALANYNATYNVNDKSLRVFLVK